MLRNFVALGGLAVVASLAAAAPASAQATVVCAREGGYCNVPYPTTVIYGAGGATSAREVGPRGVPCNNQVFGDPAVGMGKVCRYFVRGGREFRPEPRYERRRRDYD